MQSRVSSLRESQSAWQKMANREEGAKVQQQILAIEKDCEIKFLNDDDDTIWWDAALQDKLQ